MELSEAKEILKNIVGNGYYISPMEHPQETARAGIEAIDTVLKALDNSISKDEVRKKIEELSYSGKGTYIRGEKILILQELLGE